MAPVESFATGPFALPLILSRAASGTFEGVRNSTFERAGIREARDLQPMIVANPEVLGEPLLVLSPEFRGFEASADRADILALDKSATLVVVELKRDDFASYADLQGLRYAARVRSMTLEQAADALVSWKGKTSTDYDKPDAIQEILQFLEWDEEAELENLPRIILASRGFSAELLTTVLYLAEYEVPITCVTLTPYEVNGSVIIVPDRILPLREEQEYRRGIEIKRASARTRGSDRRPRTMAVLRARGLAVDGQEAVMKHNLPAYVPEGIWETDNRFRGALVATPNGFKLKWAQDDQLYTLSRVSSMVLSDFHPEGLSPSVSGPFHWGTKEECFSRIAEAALGLAGSEDVAE